MGCQIYDRFLCDVDEHITFKILKLKVNPFIKPITMIPQCNELPKNEENVCVRTGVR